MPFATIMKRHAFHAKCLAILVMFIFAWACTPVKPVKDLPPAPVDYILTILHTNDTHSSFGGITDKGMTCYAAMCENGKGGYVRLDQAVRAIRQHTPDALFLEAGDIFQGTLFWTQHKERMPLALVDTLGYEAMIAGNHEFDDGEDTYLRMVNKLETPVLGANMSFRPGIAHRVKPYTIVERAGHKIGIVGIVQPDTPALSSAGPDVQFGNAQAALQKAVAELESQGINIIVAITHLGLEDDKKIARQVNGVDVIVGAHSHSLLTNNPELQEKADGPYPVVEKTPNGEPVLVVTAYTACIYLGKLDVGFDSQGIVRSWQGEPIVLDDATLRAMNAPAPNAAMVRIVNDFAKPVTRLMSSQLGFIKTDLAEGLPLEKSSVKECRQVECLTGNIVADSLRTVSFDDVQIVLLNGGSLRNSLPSGKVTAGHVIGTLPFQNTAVKAKMSGEIILQALEHGVSNYNEDEGRFLQVSGLRYAFAPARAEGSRITKVEVQGNNGQWQALDPKTTYVVGTQDYMAKGGDSFNMLKSLQWEEGDKLSNDVLRLYMEKHSPVEAKLEGRITVQQ